MPYRVRNLTLGIVVYNLYMCEFPVLYFRVAFLKWCPPFFWGMVFVRGMFGGLLSKVCVVYTGAGRQRSRPFSATPSLFGRGVVGVPPYIVGPHTPPPRAGPRAPRPPPPRPRPVPVLVVVCLLCWCVIACQIPVRSGENPYISMGYPCHNSREAQIHIYNSVSALTT